MKRWFIVFIVIILIVLTAFGILLFKHIQIKSEYCQTNASLENECRSSLGSLDATITNCLNYINSAMDDEENISYEFGSIISFGMASIDVLDSVERLLLQLDSYARISNPEKVSEIGYLPISLISDLHEQLIYEVGDGELSYSELYDYLLSMQLLLSGLQAGLKYAQEQSEFPLEINYFFLEYLNQNQTIFS